MKDKVEEKLVCEFTFSELRENILSDFDDKNAKKGLKLLKEWIDENGWDFVLNELQLVIDEFVEEDFKKRPKE